MKIILIYLSIGVLANIFGSWANKIKEAIDDIKIENKADEFLRRESNQKWKKIAFELILRFLILIAYPILYGILVYDYFFSLDKKYTVSNNIKDANKLYYCYIGGAGTIYCKECTYSQDIISFLHSFGEKSCTKSGFQCQECGKFHEIECDSDNSKDSKCECGGELNRQKAIFCPKCKSYNMNYQMNCIT